MLRKAERKKAKLKIGIAGPSGSGKTMSALKLAKGICGDWGRVAIIDTENGSADLYSHLGEYNVITLSAPFSPEKFISSIEECEKAGMEVIIIDSITHEWKYIIDMVDKLTQGSASKNSYTAWGKATPIHDKFIQAILQSKCHIITTVRSKQDYDMGKDQNGKTIVQKVGMKQETRDGFEYELTISLDIDQQHNATASKDRTNQFLNIIPFVISEETGEMLANWNNSGVDTEAKRIKTVEELENKINNSKTIDELKIAFEETNNSYKNGTINEQDIDYLKQIKDGKKEQLTPKAK